MKIKSLFLSAIVMCSSALAFANGATCKPESNQTGWRQAEVSYLSNASQVLFQVKASGTYLAADFICNLDNCTGFIDGGPAAARLTLDPKDSSKVTSLTIEWGSAFPKATFLCN